MTGSQPQTQDADETLASDYVLGVLDESARRQVEQRMRREPDFAARVKAWEARLAEPNDGSSEAPAPNLMPARGSRRVRRTRTLPSGSRLSRLVGWMSGAAVGTVLVLAIVALVAPPRSMRIATLATPDDRLAYAIEQVGSSMKVSRIAGEAAAEGLVHELWLFAPGQAPVSLGLLATGPLILEQPAPLAGWTLAISLEPAGGSGMGVPTGPLIISVEIGV